MLAAARMVIQLRQSQKEDLAQLRLPTTRPASPYQQGGRLGSDWVAAFDRNRWPLSVGIGGRFASDSATVSTYIGRGGLSIAKLLIEGLRKAGLPE